MEKIKLLMLPIKEDYIEFYLVDKLLKERDNKCDFHLKRFDILEIQNYLYSISEYWLKEEDNTFSLDLEIAKSDHTISLYIINNEKEESQIKLRELEISSSTGRDGYSKIRNLIILSKKIVEVKISNIEIESLEFINREWLSDLRINYVTLEEFIIKSWGMLEIQNSNIKEMSVLWIKKDYKSSISVSKSTIKQLMCDNSYIDSFVYYKAEIEWGKVSDTEINTVIIEKSNFWELRFFNVILVNPATITKSFIENMRMFNVSWNSSLLDNSNIEPLDLKDTYRQIKYIYENSYNQTEANKFFAKEMKYYMQSIKGIPSKRWDYLIVWLQKEISDFGNDWSRAVIIYFIVALLWFWLAEVGDMVCKFLSNKAFYIPEFKAVWLEFIRYINPLPKTDEVPWLWYLLVSITKILIVYQIVVALRRISQR